MFQTFHPKYVVNTPYLFFTGKGGVGKTSTACATAVALADRGKKVLIVSTDPASNLQDVFDIEIGNQPIEVPYVPNLSACNIDPEESARQYREKVISPYRNALPESVVATMEEQLSGACTVEIAAFDEFSNLLTNQDLISQYDHILFDTAPTGHTLRLLQLPTAWSSFLEESTHGASCLGPLSGLGEKKQLYTSTVKALSDPNMTTLILVARPEPSSMLEAERASAELKEIGMENQVVIINGLLQSHVEDDPISKAFYDRQRKALADLPQRLKQVGMFSVPFVPFSLTGVDNLRKMFKSATYSAERSEVELSEAKLNSLQELIDDFAEKDMRIIFTMGKGGVGKTTMASAIAVGLAEKGLKVHLTTTDPAAHLEYTFQQKDAYRNLTISRLDPKKEVEAYKETVLSQNKDQLDEDALAYLEEDLNSPCTEEIAVFQAFADIVEKSKDEIVVIDTAPTGHTLLLLNSAESYHKEISRSKGTVSESVQNLLPKLRNPEETSVVIVTLPEATPVLEATRLRDDLKRASIEPVWWVINQSLYAQQTTDPILQSRADAEKVWIKRVSEEIAERTSIVPWQPEEKIGYDKMKDLINH
ncbi:arsenical pump-driving ATPase [Mesobacillus selenatarsenatis]|uniref:Arsenical pump-driving ATPase n=1 Tax=Mesobacillus selenatarsenatis (strain DSM 18680 / JCM 14380 / FERM P-15431 / SF-1) TaxID=1321606 RepID=A0A0A8X684_MESS1|nr:arsenical pump-driving ATPase [Mesobacillus selenatarsenatis]GAM15465.1 arsenical pump-driving ATPase [Mesobacillus selenatarsenatis SF-1]